MKLPLPLLALAVLLASCAATEPAPLRAGSNFLHPPFSSLDEDGQAVGVEVELVAAAGARLGRDVEWRELAFSELLAAVESGELDVAASTIGITDERLQILDFGESYYTTQIVALVRQRAGEPRTLDELSGRRVVTERGTTAVEALRERVPEAVRVLDRPEGRAWAEMLAAGEVDAVVLDASHVEKFCADAGTSFHVITEPLRAEHFGLPTRRGETELREALDEAIRAAREGTAGTR